MTTSLNSQDSKLLIVRLRVDLIAHVFRRLVEQVADGLVVAILRVLPKQALFAAHTDLRSRDSRVARTATKKRKNVSKFFNSKNYSPAKVFVIDVHGAAQIAHREPATTAHLVARLRLDEVQLAARALAHHRFVQFHFPEQVIGLLLLREKTNYNSLRALSLPPTSSQVRPKCSSQGLSHRLRMRCIFPKRYNLQLTGKTGSCS